MMLVCLFILPNTVASHPGCALSRRTGECGTGSWLEAHRKVSRTMLVHLPGKWKRSLQALHQEPL